MTFETYELSAQDGAPVELYLFEVGPTSLRYTSSAASVSYNTETWQAAAMQRSQLETNAVEERTSLTVTVARNHPVAELYRVAPPSAPVFMTLYRLHHGDTDARVLWSGRVMNAAWRGIAAELLCEPASVSLERSGLRRVYQRQCPHKLYGPACRLSKTAFDVVATVSAVSGITVSAAAFASAAEGYYSGGAMEWTTSSGMIERRMIMTHTGNSVTLNLPFVGLAAGASVTVYPGCDHTLSTCASKFSNVVNFGGFPYIPTKNPHGSSPIY